MFSIEFIEKKEVAEKTFLYTFTRPEGYEFEAGQYATMRLLEGLPYSDDRGNARAFSFASAPYEKHLGFMMRKSESGFKQNIHSLKEGDEAQLSKAIGKCTLSQLEKGNPLVVICAGVGYTPVRSLLRQVVYENKKFPMVVINSNRKPESTPEYEWISSMGRTYENITIVNTMTDLPEGMAGCVDCRGRINADMVRRYACDTPETLYFVVAGANFITSMREMLAKMGISEERVFFDNFG